MKDLENLKLISQKQLLEIIPISRTTLWRWEQRSDFPQKIILGPSRVAYRVSDVEKWLNNS